MPNDTSDIALNLARLRIANDLSQEALANRLGLSRQAVSKWERGESVPDLGNLIALSDLYSVTVDELIRGPREEGTLDPAIPSTALAEEAPPSLVIPEDPSEEGLLLERRPTKHLVLIDITALVIIVAIGSFAAISFSLQDRGRATPIAGNGTKGARDDSVDYDGRLMVVAQETFDPQQIEGFSLKWYNGNVNISSSDEANAAGTIQVTESSTIRLADDETMRCDLRDGILEITTVHAGLLMNAPQHLDILVPSNIEKTFKSLYLAGLASDYSIKDISCETLETRLPSNDSSVSMSGVAANNLIFDKSGRGNAVLEGSFEQMSISQTYGAVRVMSSIRPDHLQAYVSSGDLSITLPKDSAFAASVDMKSGAFSCDFERFGTASIYSIDDEDYIEAHCYGRPGITSPLYRLTGQTSRIAIDPSADTIDG